MKNRKDISTYTIHDIVKDMKTGWNLGNSLDAEGPKDEEYYTVEYLEKYWANPIVTKELVTDIIETGFNTIRIGVNWSKAIDKNDPGLKMREDWINRVQEVVDYAYDEGVYVIINCHHEEDWLIPDDEHKETAIRMLTRIWTNVSERFKEYDHHLIFETMNETRLVGTEYEWNEGTKEARDIINLYHKVCYDIIRSSGGLNATRPLLMNTYGARAGAVALAELEIPNDDDRVILGVHAYSPYEFCMVPDETANWGTEEEKKALVDLLDSLSEVAKHKNRPLLIGEYGTVNKENEDVRALYTQFYVSECKKRNIRAYSAFAKHKKPVECFLASRFRRIFVRHEQKS